MNKNILDLIENHDKIKYEIHQYFYPKIKSLLESHNMWSIDKFEILANNQIEVTISVIDESGNIDYCIITKTAKEWAT